ncbi:hypothetical protein [Pseudoxanthomonas suwonensis]|uniref:hypothetical protein n=1 Tax=Pseudoxanthomonas suwonensis TaxID=314722 RepID=UPI002E80EE15|nr:hypothetical protein [Pseudoxanthomonas suwonensis]
MAAPEQSAVSWAAILAGAAAAAALSLILLILGVGLGMSTVSPWSYEGVSREAFGWSTIAWITLTSIAASGLGGYLAGRLRTRWVSVHTDETYFRDTAHGFLAWAVATLLTAAVLTTAIGAILGTGAKALGSAAGASATAAGGIAAAGAGAAASDDAENDIQYWVDAMFRQPAAAAQLAPSDDPTANGAATGPLQARIASSASARPATPATADTDLRPEIGRILANGLRGDALDADDARYIAQRIAERTGLGQAEAQARVTELEASLRARLDEAETQAREVADEARKASAYAALWLFITLLIGAFSASLLATFGGRQRDR